VLAAGLLPAFIVALEPLWRSILKPEFISAIESVGRSLVRTVPQLGSTQMLMVLVTAIPLLTGLAAFTLEARTGFNLYGPGTRSVYLPNGLRDVITHVRNVQDIQQEVMHVVQGETESKDAGTQAS
jgi:hypothetical protein